MKKWLIFLFLISVVSASVDVDSFYVKDNYVFSESINGYVNLTIEDEYYDEEIVFSNGSSIVLGEFLEDNGVDFECFPNDCSQSYDVSPGVTDKTILVSSLSKEYIGFVLQGDNVVLESMDFRIATDFGEGAQLPLSIRFFEDWDWKFDKFSDSFLPKDWGCFDESNKEIGARIGSSFYCEMIRIGDSDKLRVGAEVSGSGGVLTMAVYPSSGFGGYWECSFNPSVGEEYCDIDATDGIFSEGDYQVCVGADALTNYNIYEDRSGESCGFAYDIGPENSVKDYGIFAQGVKYASAGYIEEFVFDESDVEAANRIIIDRYGGDCSEGCILPLEVFGVEQNFRIYDVDLVYTDNFEWYDNNLVHGLTKSAAKVYFPLRNDSGNSVGTLDLGFLGIGVEKEGEYFAKLAGEDLFRKKVSLLPAPIISAVSPLSVPAGVPVVFYASVNSKSNKSLSYEWDFGDNKTEKTNVPYVVHSYRDLQSYILSLRVSAGGNLSSEKKFNIEAISPEEAVSEGLSERKEYLKNVKATIATFPSWYGDEISKILEIDRFDDELDRLESKANNSFDAEDFRDVAVDLYDMDIPVSIGMNSFEMPFLMTDLDDIDIEPVSIISGALSGGTNDEYAGPILTWQEENIDSVVNRKVFFVSYLKGDVEDFFSVYSFKIDSKANEESYFIINKPFGELYFKDASGARKAGEASAIILNSGETKGFEFYYKDGVEAGFFVSPRLSSVVIEEDIKSDCNFNEICEESLGENPDNCRSDCKPTSKAIFFVVVVVLIFLLVYSALQIWYKKHYEAYLFRDASQLYNLLMYISNARARDIDEGEIASTLKKRGWNSERVDYIMKKSRGETVGMIEIIPIERVSAMIRNWKARKAVRLARETATRAIGVK